MSRYMQAAFCSWYSTGGSIEGLLQPLSLQQLKETGTYQGGAAGVMFEKVSLSPRIPEQQHGPC